MISRQFGDDALGGAGSALGRSVRIAGDTCEVVGVWPRRVVFLGTPADIWAPLHYDVKAADVESCQPRLHRHRPCQ